MQKVSVIIPTIKGREGLVKKLLSTIPKEHEVIIVDDEDLLLAAKQNKGAMKASGEYLLFADDDNYLECGAIEKALENMVDDYKIVGFMACYDNDPSKICDGGSRRNMLTGFTFGMNTNKSYDLISHYPYEVDEVSNVFMIERETFLRLGMFNEIAFPIELNEADLCQRIKRNGGKVIIVPKARCFHKSITYSRLPDFRREKSAFYMGRNKILFQKRYLSLWGYRVFCLFFLPVYIIGYMVALFIRKKPKMFYYFTKGVIYGCKNCTENIY